MAYRHLQHFIETLEQRGELVRVHAPVSPVLEITEIADRVSKRHGKALLFTHVEGSEYPLLINAFGSYERMSLALGAQNLDDIAAELEQYLDFSHYTSIPRLIAFAPRLLRLLCCFPLRRRLTMGHPACQQVVEQDPDLFKLPVLQCWPQDGGRFFTLPLVFTKYPDSGCQNVGMYRMQILDRSTTAMHWHKHKDGAGIYEAYRKRGGKMPVSVALGCDPAITYAATAPLPPKIDEMMLAGWLRRRPVSMVRCVTNEVYVPADAQFVLEGYVDTEEDLAWEGPFGDHTGYYSLADWYPRFHVTAVTHRRDAVYPATVVGKPPMEDCYMAKATERIFLPLLRMTAPQIVDMNLPLEGVFHNLAILSVQQDYPGAARTVMNAIWGMGQMRYTKMIITVDGSVDPYDIGAVTDAVLTWVDVAEDLILSKGPLDALDHASDQALYGTRLGVDATSQKSGVSGAEHTLGTEDARSANIAPGPDTALGADNAPLARSVSKPGSRPPQKGTLSIRSIHKAAPMDSRTMAKQILETTMDRFTILVDDTEDPGDWATVMWRLFNHIDAARDLYVDAAGGHAVIDATKKTKEEGLRHPWPDDIVMSEEMKQRVTRRWNEYGIDNL